MLAETKVMTDGAAKTGPVIGKVSDASTGSLDTTLTAGMPIIVEGSNIKVAGEKEGIGFFFIPASEGKAAVKASVLVDNNPPGSL